MVNAPTLIQLKILKEVASHRAVHGVSPTLKELGNALGRSKVTIFGHVEELIRKQLITKEPNGIRSLLLTERANPYVSGFERMKLTWLALNKRERKQFLGWAKAKRNGA